MNSTNAKSKRSNKQCTYWYSYHRLKILDALTFCDCSLPTDGKNDHEWFCELLHVDKVRFVLVWSAVLPVHVYKYTIWWGTFLAQLVSVSWAIWWKNSSGISVRCFSINETLAGVQTAATEIQFETRLRSRHSGIIQDWFGWESDFAPYAFDHVTIGSAQGAWRGRKSNKQKKKKGREEDSLVMSCFPLVRRARVPLCRERTLD